MSTTLYSDSYARQRADDTDARSQPRPRLASRISGEVWQMAGMVVVAVATLSFVVSLWLM